MRLTVLHCIIHDLTYSGCKRSSYPQGLCFIAGNTFRPQRVWSGAADLDIYLIHLNDPAFKRVLHEDTTSRS